MASPHGGITITTSPKGVHHGESGSPKGGGGGGQCLCSPTTHQGSFRCRFHRSGSSAWMKRSNSMPARNDNSGAADSSSSSSSVAPKSIDQSA